MASKPLSVAAALAQARAAGVERLDAQWMLGHLTGRSRAWLLAHDEQALPESATGSWPGLLERRARGEPLAYVLGRTEFCELTLQVSPAVLIPRPETELLVEWALECLNTAPAPTLVDLGTGSGAIALALLHARPHLQGLATDASEVALAFARANAQALGLSLHLAHGDWWTAVGNARFGLAVSNPPYIASGDPHLPALAHEPEAALSPGGDGLDALRRIVAGAPLHLLPGAWLLLEHGHDQAEAVHALLADQGFEEPQTRLDLAGMPRCTGACWPAAN